MSRKWHSFEERVRGIATLIYGNTCYPARIGGVDIDGVVEIDPGHFILIEITVEKKLQKVRDDIIKLRTARAALLAEKEALAECFCIIDMPVTTAMTEAGLPHRIKVFDGESFSRIFFNFTRYKIARERAKFGSAVNPLNGRSDEYKYIGVNYVSELNGEEYNISSISKLLQNNKKVILLGEYGAGKSRCLKEIFFRLCEDSTSNLCFPIAVDLREAWGLKRGVELIRRHFEDLGLESMQNSAITALGSGSLTMLIDGFDEIGSQAWSNDGQQLKAIRAQALQGVKDLIQRSDGGVLITGRDHYFSNNEEMFSCLGLSKEKTVVIRCKSEFTQQELLEYFSAINIDVTIPPWLPRRPLICQTIVNLGSGEIEEMFDLGGGGGGFLESFDGRHMRKRSEYTHYI